MTQPALLRLATLAAACLLACSGTKGGGSSSAASSSGGAITSAASSTGSHSSSSASSASSASSSGASTSTSTTSAASTSTASSSATSSTGSTGASASSTGSTASTGSTGSTAGTSSTGSTGSTSGAGSTGSTGSSGSTGSPGCTYDYECGTGQYCAGGACAPMLGVGAVCTRSTECVSYNCQQAQGDMRCAGPNQYCTATCQVVSDDGTYCTNAAAGTDPRSECVADPSSCRGDFCDGAGGCKAPVGTPCGPVNCYGSGAIGGFICNTSGFCTNSSGQCPGGYGCNATWPYCLTSCASDADCSTTSKCDLATSQCVPLASPGTACQSDAECASHHCLQAQTGRVCALVASCPPCQVASQSGYGCTNAAAGTDPKDDCTASTPDCLADACDGAGTCHVPAGTSCAPSTCTAASQTDSLCDASGACQARTTPCSTGVACAGATCASACAQTADCPGGTWCQGGVCLPRRADGAGCSLDDQCLGGHCLQAQGDQRCSALPGCGPCQVVSADGSACVNAAAGTDPKGECTADPANCVLDSCNGQGGCLQSPGDVCRPPDCTGWTSTEEYRCDANLHCAVTNSHYCGLGAYACNQATGECYSSCTSNAQCGPYDTCQGGVCR